MHRVLLVLAMGAVMISSNTKEARADDYDVIGAGCMPSMENYYGQWPGSTIYYSATNDSVGFHPTNGPVGTLLRFYCPMPRTITAPGHIYLLYSRNAGDSLTASLMEVSKTDGSVSQVATATATGTGVGAVDMPFTHSYDVNWFTYYVEVTISNGSSVGSTSSIRSITVY